MPTLRREIGRVKKGEVESLDATPSLGPFAEHQNDDFGRLVIGIPELKADASRDEDHPPGFHQDFFAPDLGHGLAPDGDDHRWERVGLVFGIFIDVLSLGGNTTTSDVSNDLTKPKQWLPEGSFRLYDSKNFKNVRKGITVCYSDVRITEPILILASIEYYRKDEAQDWDIWYLYLEGDEKILNKKYVEDKPTRNYIGDGIIKKAAYLAMKLVDIENEEEVKNKIADRLKEL